MNLEQLCSLVYLGFFFTGFVIPVVAFQILRRIFRHTSGRRHFCRVVVVTWVLLATYMIVTTPIRVAYVTSQAGTEDDRRALWDGTGENSGVLVLGWILPAVALFTFLACTSLIRVIRDRFFR